MATQGSGKTSSTEHNTNKGGASGRSKTIMINPHTNAKRPDHPTPVNSRKVSR